MSVLEGAKSSLYERPSAVCCCCCQRLTHCHVHALCATSFCSVAWLPRSAGCCHSWSAPSRSMQPCCRTYSSCTQSVHAGVVGQAGSMLLIPALPDNFAQTCSLGNTCLYSRQFFIEPCSHTAAQRAVAQRACIGVCALVQAACCCDLSRPGESPQTCSLGNIPLFGGFAAAMCCQSSSAASRSMQPHAAQRALAWRVCVW